MMSAMFDIAWPDWLQLKFSELSVAVNPGQEFVWSGITFEQGELACLLPPR